MNQSGGEILQAGPQLRRLCLGALHLYSEFEEFDWRYSHTSASLVRAVLSARLWSYIHAAAQRPIPQVGDMVIYNTANGDAEYM